MTTEFLNVGTKSTPRALLGPPMVVHESQLYPIPGDCCEGSMGETYMYLPVSKSQYNAAEDPAKTQVNLHYETIRTEKQTLAETEIIRMKPERDLVSIIKHHAMDQIAAMENNLFGTMLRRVARVVGGVSTVYEGSVCVMPDWEILEQIKYRWPTRYPDARVVDHLFAETKTLIHIDKKDNKITWWAENTYGLVLFPRPVTHTHRYKFTMEPV